VKRGDVKEKEKQEKEKKAINKKIHTKLMSMGMHVGQRLAEKYTKDQVRFSESKDSLDVIKFICKDFWTAVFRKQIDKLQTNHRGIYVLHDFSFRWLARISSAGNVVEEAKPYTYFACGIIKGALLNLGFNTTVKADIGRLPQCKFTIVDSDTFKKDQQNVPGLSSGPSGSVAGRGPSGSISLGGSGGGGGGGSAGGMEGKKGPHRMSIQGQPQNPVPLSLSVPTSTPTTTPLSTPTTSTTTNPALSS